MKLCRWAVISGLTMVLAAVSLNCNKLIPAIKHTINFGSATILPGNFGGAAGTPIELQQGFVGELNNMPSEQSLQNELQALVGNLGNIIEIRSIGIDEIVVQATSGNLSFITEIILLWRPRPDGGVEQPEREIGRGTAEDGSATRFIIRPAAGVDLLSLIRENDANSGPGNPSYRILISGFIPSEAVTFTTQVKVSAQLGFGKAFWLP